MTKYSPRNLQDNVNVSKISLKKEFLVLLGGLLGILLGVYIFLGMALDILVDRIPGKLEKAVGRLIDYKKFDTPDRLKDIEDKTQDLLDNLVSRLPDQTLNFKIHIIDTEDANALALPGGHILLLSGVLDDIESENELAMILAHEIGHYVHKDHLRGIGRGLIFLFLSSILFGTDSGVTDFVTGSISAIDLKFSREQEMAADKFALILIQKKYGHVAGATDFFRKMREKEKLNKYLSFISTHPDSDRRIEILDHLILNFHFERKALKPLDPAFHNIFHKGRRDHNFSVESRQ